MIVAVRKYQAGQAFHASTALITPRIKKIVLNLFSLFLTLPITPFIISNWTLNTGMASRATQNSVKIKAPVDRGHGRRCHCHHQQVLGQQEVVLKSNNTTHGTNCAIFETKISHFSRSSPISLTHLERFLYSVDININQQCYSVTSAQVCWLGWLYNSVKTFISHHLRCGENQTFQRTITFGGVQQWQLFSNHKNIFCCQPLQTIVIAASWLLVLRRVYYLVESPM